MNQFLYDIFISYSQKDREAAERLEAAFEAHNFKVWRDERLLDSPTGDFAGTINDALERSARAVVLWSRNSVDSPWVLGEAERARMAGRIVPLALEPVDALLPHIPTPFNILPTIGVSAETLDLAPVLRALGAEQAEGQPEGALSLSAADVDISKLPDTYAEKLYGRGREMAALVHAWDFAITRIFALDAIGGAGKTALVYHFVQALKVSGWRGAHSAFAWSFYAQGSNEDRQTGADGFFKAAFEHFGGKGTLPPLDPRQKGVDLAHLVQARRSLLILDGLEPLQYAAPGSAESSTQAGGIKDPGIKALLSLLADRNPGLCIVTSRIRPAELAGFEGVTFEELGEIPLMDAIELLRDLGVEPCTPAAKFKLPPASEFALLTPPYELPPAYAAPEASSGATMPAAVAKEFIEAVKELKGHALALTLAGRHLATYHSGDIRAIHDLLDEAPPGAANECASYRVMRAIETALTNRIAGVDERENPASEAAGRQLALLFFLGFFDHPADRELLPAVFSEAAPDLKPDPADSELAATGLLAIKKQLWGLDQELQGGGVSESRRQEIEREQEPLIAKRKEAIEADRRALVRRLFAGMHAVSGDGHAVADGLSLLADQGLVPGAAGKDACIDCHPLVREYFGARLKELDGEVYRAAHGRLYDHLRYAGLPAAFHNPVAYGVIALGAAYPDQPFKQDLLKLADGLLPEEVLQAWPPSLSKATPEQLRNGAALIGGAEWECALAAFLPRTKRGCRRCSQPSPMAARRSGRTRPSPRSIGHALSAATSTSRLQSSAFSATTWRRWRASSRCLSQHLRPRLAAGVRALVLNLTGLRLRALGRLEDAVAPMRGAVSAFAELQDWKNASVNAAISASYSSPSAGFPARRAPSRRAKRPLPSRTAPAMPSSA